MTSDVLRKILVAGARVAALSVAARKQQEQMLGGAWPEPSPQHLWLGRPMYPPKRIDPG